MRQSAFTQSGVDDLLLVYWFTRHTGNVYGFMAVMRRVSLGQTDFNPAAGDRIIGTASTSGATSCSGAISAP